MRYDDHMWGYNWGWGEWILMTSLMVVFWAAVITAIVLAVRYLANARSSGDGRSRPSGPEQSRAEQVLGERFARGEIDDDEYRSRMKTLREHH